MNVYEERTRLLARLGALLLEQEKVRAQLAGLDMVIGMLPKPKETKDEQHPPAPSSERDSGADRAATERGG